MGNRSESQCRKHRLPWRVVWKVALLLLVLVTCAVGFAFYRGSSCPIAFVDAKEIKRIDVLYMQSNRSITVFPVDDQATIVKILDAMRPISRDWSPAKWQVYGCLKIEFANGTKTYVGIYSPHEEVAAFSIDRRYFRGGSEFKLKDILESEGKKKGRVVNING